MTAASPRIAVLIKQVPVAEELRLSADGRLVREGTARELNPHCRRAVNQACMLAGEGRGSVTALTLGPPEAEHCLREAVAWGADRGVLVSDAAFAGSDTFATARALHAALKLTGPYDLVLTGRNSIDSDTGQVGPEIAELLGWPFLGAVRELVVDAGRLHVVCELDDGVLTASVRLPAVLACAERLCAPAKVDAKGRAAVTRERLRVVRAADLGPGPWGAAGSLTEVGVARPTVSSRERIMLQGTVDEQVSLAVAHLGRRRAFSAEPSETGVVGEDTA
ncbi:MAG: electron transfer flavoprotein subunit beta/FixA family protein, partial [Sciscionella sp.]